MRIKTEEQVVEFLTKRPSYLKWGKQRLIDSRKVFCSINILNKVFKNLKHGHTSK